MSIQVGQQAPALDLPDQDGELVALRQLAGRWVVLYFYPKDDTPGCTTQACEFTTGLEAFRGLEAEVIGVSPDSPESHQRFIGKHGLGVRLLSDPDHRVMERYGAWGEKILYGRTSVGVIRSTVLIDPQGQVAHHWKRARAAGHAGHVERRLRELRGGSTAQR